MAKYDISITNGTGQQEILNGSYTIASNIKGYDNTTIDPKNVTFDASKNTLNLTIAGNATLTLHVTENETSTGTAVSGATFQRCNQDGTVSYGNPVTSDSTGNAIFEHFPYDTSEPITVYYKQLNSDGSHEFDNTVKTISMDNQTKLIEVKNAKASLRTLTVKDQYYQEVSDINGTISLD